jgi:hypothetical protein
MKNLRFLYCFLLVAVVLILSACAPAAKPVIYKVVSEGTLKAGSPIPIPTDKVVLTMEGNISQKNVGETLQFDMATLESIGLVQYKVNDPFEKKSIVYSGVLLSELLKVAGADKAATTLKLWALDDYSTDMKVSDANKWPVLIATQADGVYMPVNKKGPLISVFPFDDFSEIDHLTYDNQWLWALAKITVNK